MNDVITAYHNFLATINSDEDRKILEDAIRELEIEQVADLRGDTHIPIE
jgi:hypothetical protein